MQRKTSHHNQEDASLTRLNSGPAQGGFADIINKTHDQEGLVRAVISAMADPLFVYDSRGKVVDANDAAKSSYGFDPVGLGQQEIIEKAKLRLLDGRKMEPAEMASGRALRGEPVRNLNFLFNDAQGNQRVALASAAPIRKGDAITGAVAYWLDVTEQYRVEAELAWEAEEHASMAEVAQALLHSAPLEDLSHVVLEKAKKLTVSPYGFIGYVDPDTGNLVCPTLSRDMWKGCKVEGKTVIFKGTSAASGLGGWVWEYRKPLMTNLPSADSRSRGIPEGHVPIQRFLGAPAIFGDLRVGMLAVANSQRDYTQKDLVVVERLAGLYALAIQRKRAEGALRESREKYRTLSENLEKTVRDKVSELQQAERLANIGQMVSVVAHEIRNPLQNISLNLEMVSAGPAQPELLEPLEGIKTGVESLNSLVEEILDFSRPVQLKRADITIEELVSRALSEINYKLAKYQLVLDLYEKEKYISVDADKMVRVLVNLMMNSIEAMPDGGTLTISTCLQPHGERNYLFLSITDTGAGIPEEDLERIEHPFYTTKSRGTGLGLSICRKIIDAHKGTLWLRSQPGKGTAAEIGVPV